MKLMMFSENLRNLIHSKKLSLTKISKETDIPLSTLSEWTGGRDPKVSERLIRLCRYLDTTLDQLVLNECLSGEPKTIALVTFEIEKQNYILKIYKPKETGNV